MIKFLRLCFFIFIGTITFISCSDSPTSLGTNFLQDQDKIQFTVYDSKTENTRHNTYSYENKNFLNGSSTNIIFGRNEYAEAQALLTFYPRLADSTWTKFEAGKTQILSASVTIRTNYSLGNKTQPFDFVVNQIDVPWDVYKVNKDSLSKFNNHVDVSLNHVFTDSTITFNLKTSVIHEWLNAQLDTNNKRNYGLIIRPTSGSNKFRGFANPASSDSSLILNYILRRIPQTYFDDTLTVSSTNGTFIVTERKVPDPNSFTFQSGYSRRGFLWFNLATLPKNIIISKAVLELTKNESASIDGDPASNMIKIVMLSDSTNKKLTSDSLYASYLSKPDGSNIYSGTVSWMVQTWCSGKDNQGVMLSLSDETGAVSRIQFYDSKETDVTKRPRLTVYYTKK